MEFVSLEKGKANTLMFYVTLADVPVTALTDASFALWYSKNGAAPEQITITGLVTELDDTNMPGVYSFALTSASFDEYGNYMFRLTGAGLDPIVLLADVQSLNFLKDIRSMSKGNYLLDNAVYDGQGNLTSGDISLFDPDADIDLDTPRLVLTLTTTYNAQGNVTEMRVTE